MAKGFKMGGGGGGTALNFRVVKNPQPTNPRENCIWVNTDVDITSWIFSATAPSPAESGTVWIYVGTSSSVAFNCLKKNGIQVYPLAAKQYVGGAWVDKTAKSYQGGKWVDLVTRADLYKNGDECSQITGGWSYQKNTASYWNGASNLTKNANSFTVSVSSQNGHGGAMTNNAIDVSSKGVLVVNITDFERSGSTGRCVVILSKARDFAANNYANRVAEFEFENKGAHSIDISSVNEPCYILVAAASEGHTCSVTCDEVYVE